MKSTFTPVVFFRVLWPEFSWVHLYYTVLLYQRNYATIQARRREHQQLKASHQQVVDKKKLTNGHTEKELNEERALRTKNFLDRKKAREEQYWADLSAHDTYSQQ
jgi:hypothetical protein